MLGEDAPSGDSPLLMKVIFAREKLSVQVHPDDRLAQKYGQPRGKTECWYALAAEAGAQVAAGLKAGVTMDEVKTGIEAGTLEKSLRMLPVSAGDMVYVDAGTVHAIWPGIGVAGDTAELRSNVQNVRLWAWARIAHRKIAGGCAAEDQSGQGGAEDVGRSHDPGCQPLFRGGEDSR